MKANTHLPLLIALMMFPQFVETIYSPALPLLSERFNISAERASMTLSLYFIAFAIGIVFWGILSDRIGRKSVMMMGLIVYGFGALIGLVTSHFEILLFARMIAAFGAAVGSVVTQTIMRDRYKKEELSYIFSIMGIALSLSPVVGMLIGALLSSYLGLHGVFGCLLALAVILIGATKLRLVESRPPFSSVPSLWNVFLQMVADRSIWKASGLVASFNIILFSYYALAPYVFEEAGHSSTEYGFSGLLLAAGSFIGGISNKAFIKRKVSPFSILLSATLITCLGGLGVYCIEPSIWFIAPFVLCVIGYGIAIPTILSKALVDYQQVVGTAAAIFGLFYYILIGIGLSLSGLIQDLGVVIVLMSFAALFLICTGSMPDIKRP